MIKLKGAGGVTYRTSTLEDAIELTGENPINSFKAISFFIDNELIAMAGYKMEAGHFIVFSDFKKDVKINKVSIWRGALVVMDMIAKENIPMYAVAHNERLCAKLGFKRVRGDLYKWQQC